MEMALMWKKWCQEEGPGGGLRKVLCMLLLIATVVGMCSGLETVTVKVPWSSLQKKHPPVKLPVLYSTQRRDLLFDAMSIPGADVPKIYEEGAPETPSLAKMYGAGSYPPFLLSSDMLLRTMSDDGSEIVPVPMPVPQPKLTPETEVTLVFNVARLGRMESPGTSSL